ncbi:MAG: MFS transporter [Jatrophihabitantaceae bacterium]
MKQLGPGFWRLYASSATSNLADGIGRTALPLLAAYYTRSPLLISGLASLAFLPWLFFALPSGALVDRVDRRYAMAAANAVRAVATAALGVLVLTHLANIVVLYTIAFALGVAETVYDSATRAILAQVVTTDRLDSANGLLTVEETLGQSFLGATIGSALFAFAVSAPFLLNASGFTVAAVLILTLRGRFRPTRTAAKASVRADVVEGVRWLTRHRFLRGLTLVSAGSAFVQSMGTGVLVLYVLEILRLPAGDFGYVMVGAGIGSIIGGIATPLLATRFGRGPLLVIGAVVSAVGVAGMGMTRNGYIAVILFALSGGGVMVWNVLTMSLRQALIPQALFGRVQGAYRTVVWGAIPLGSLAGGLLANAFGLRTVFVAAGAGLLVMAGFLSVLVRTHRDQLDAEPVPHPDLGTVEDALAGATAPGSAGVAGQR